MTRLLQIPAHVRRSPTNFHLAVKAVMTARLRTELRWRDAVQNACVIIQGMDELEDACLDNLKADPDYLAVL